MASGLTFTLLHVDLSTRSTRIEEIPPVLTKAILAIEDARFFQHGGVDYIGVMRAGLANIGKARSQGASTITQQVARTFFLNRSRSLGRKFKEALLSLKIESQLSKDQVLELYMNQIYLGQRAYGFAAACDTYFGKPIKDITVAEAAMLAGLPKAPSAYNPVRNPPRARLRQQYIIDRMFENGFITAEQRDAAKAEEDELKELVDKAAEAGFGFLVGVLALIAAMRS